MTLGDFVGLTDFLNIASILTLPSKDEIIADSVQRKLAESKSVR